MGETDDDELLATSGMPVQPIPDGGEVRPATTAISDANTHDRRAGHSRRPHCAFASHTPMLPRDSPVWKKFAAKITQPKHVLVEMRWPAARRELSCVANILERQCVSKSGTNRSKMERAVPCMWGATSHYHQGASSSPGDNIGPMRLVPPQNRFCL